MVGNSGSKERRRAQPRPERGAGAFRIILRPFSAEAGHEQHDCAESRRDLATSVLDSRVRILIISKAMIRASFWSVLAAAYCGALLTQAPGIYDEGLIVSGAARILHGQLPYRDFSTGYPPAQFYTIAGVFKVFGETLLAERVWDTLWRLAIVGLAIVLARAAIPEQRAHPVLLICIGLVTGACGSPLYPMISGMLPCFGAVWCAVLYLNQRGVRWLFFSGIAAGVAVLYRHDLAACVCCAVTVATCYQAIAERKKRWVLFPAIFWAGVLLVLALPVQYFWISVAHETLVQSFVDFPRMNFAGRHLPLPGPGTILAWRDFYLPLVIVVAAAITFRQVGAARRPTRVLLLMCSLSALALAAQRLDTPHVYPAIMFSLVLLCVCVATWQLENRKLLPNLLLSGAIFWYGLGALISWNGQIAELRVAAPNGSEPVKLRYSRNAPPNETVRTGPILLAFDQGQAVRYIQRHLAPGKPLYVGAATHALAWSNDALFCFLADRPPITRFDMFVPGITTGAAVQSEILGDIRQKQVEYVVLFRTPPSHEPNLSSVDNGVRILDDAIRQDYIQVAEFGRYTIWHRRDR
jgi:hypothetical protein